MTTLFRKPRDPASAGVLRKEVNPLLGEVERCACPEVGNDPDALLARWAAEDAIDSEAKDGLR